jgi:hypothetical protein
MIKHFIIVLIFFHSCAPKSEHFFIHYSGEIAQKVAPYLLSDLCTITKYKCERSGGSINDFYSEGDYWWPDPAQPDGPYIRKDGLTNPANFTAHRTEVMRLNETVSWLTTAFLTTKDQKYLTTLEAHFTSFFINPDTRMNPSLLYGQAIKGLFSGRGIGIIDTIHLIEAAVAYYKVKSKLKPETQEALSRWFEDYSTWILTHQYGRDEEKNGNNHSTWWAAQLMAFSLASGNVSHYIYAQDSYKKMIAEQMSKDGSFPKETARTKPYIYNLFNLEGFTTMCMLSRLDKTKENLWNHSSPTGSIGKAWDFMIPYIIDKGSWPLPKDLQNYNELPIASCSMIAAAEYYQNKAFITKLKALPTRSTGSFEIKRNFPHINFALWR